jgi:hypothetical protein
MDCWDAWDGYVGSQTPSEFWRYSQMQGATTYAEAATIYANDLPNIFPEDDWTAEPSLETIAVLLEEYLEKTLNPVNS